MRYHTTQQTAVYMASLRAAENGQAARAGCSAGALRYVVAVVALRSTGITARAVDLERAGLASGGNGHAMLRECVEKGYLLQIVGRGLQVTDTGRALANDTARAWERAARYLQAFEPVAPYVAQKAPKRAKKGVNQARGTE